MTKKIAIMQPYLFPYIGYWQLLNAVDEFVVYDDVNYIKKGWINRNNILLDTHSHLLTLSLLHASQNKLINEIEILDDGKNKEHFLHIIENSYKKAPYFNEVQPLLEQIILNSENNIAKYIYFSLLKISEYLEIKSKLLVSSNIEKNNALKGDDKIAHICQILNANIYINPIGGMDIYHEEKFTGKNMQLYFIETDFSKIKYTQFRNEHIKGLSIIDVMMFNSVSEIKEMLEAYNLISKNIISDKKDCSCLK